MNTEPKKIDLIPIIFGIVNTCRHLLILGLILCVLLAGFFGIRSYRSYSPVYTAEISFTVHTTNPLYAGQQYYNATTAEQMAKTFPYVLTSGVLLQRVQQQLQISVMPALSAKVLGSTNIFTLSATGSDPQLVYDVLLCLIEIYPSVAEFVVGPTTLTLIDDSGVPSHPSNNFSITGAAIKGFSIGIALWLVLAFLYWLTHRTVNNEQELQSLVNLPYFGSIPHIPGFTNNKNKGKCPVLTSRSDKFGFNESIRLLRIRVERAMEKEHAKTLLVTSTIANEGKTTLAINLATALAQKGKHVLLIDCDLRNPSVAYTYDQETMPGLCEYLEEKASLDDILFHTPEANMYAIFGGQPTQHPEKLLRQPLAKDLLVSAARSFDYVIMDTPPSALLADAADLCQLADCALLTIRQNFSCHDQILEALQILGDCNKPIIGTVLSMTAPKNKLHNYARYGYGYSRKDSSQESADE